MRDKHVHKTNDIRHWCDYTVDYALPEMGPWVTAAPKALLTVYNKKMTWLTNMKPVAYSDDEKNLCQPVLFICGVYWEEGTNCVWSLDQLTHAFADIVPMTILQMTADSSNHNAQAQMILNVYGTQLSQEKYNLVG